MPAKPTGFTNVNGKASVSFTISATTAVDGAGQNIYVLPGLFAHGWQFTLDPNQVTQQIFGAALFAQISVLRPISMYYNAGASNYQVGKCMLFVPDTQQLVISTPKNLIVSPSATYLPGSDVFQESDNILFPLNSSNTSKFNAYMDSDTLSSVEKDPLSIFEIVLFNYNPNK